MRNSHPVFRKVGWIRSTTQVTTLFSFASEATSTPSHLPHSPPLPLFRIPALLDLIAREGGWSAPPVGPIGMQLNVKDAKWVLVV